MAGLQRIDLSQNFFSFFSKMSSKTNQNVQFFQCGLCSKTHTTKQSCGQCICECIFEMYQDIGYDDQEWCLVIEDTGVMALETRFNRSKFVLRY